MSSWWRRWACYPPAVLHPPLLCWSSVWNSPDIFPSQRWECCTLCCTEDAAARARCCSSYLREKGKGGVRKREITITFITAGHGLIVAALILWKFSGHRLSWHTFSQLVLTLMLMSDLPQVRILSPSIKFQNQIFMEAFVSLLLSLEAGLLFLSATPNCSLLVSVAH